jgi:hypothetical protein
MEEKNLEDFMKVCDDFVQSSLELRDTALLCGDDPIKQDMVAFVIPDFHKMWARSEGIKLLLQRDGYDSNREFILDEMRAVTKQNLEIAKKIKDKLSGLN